MALVSNATLVSCTLGTQHPNQLDATIPAVAAVAEVPAVAATPAVYDSDGVTIVTPATPGSPEIPAIPGSPAVYGLPCDGTVYVESTDAVCYADVVYTINGTQYEQNIMNVPFQDSARLPLYIVYFINNQAAQLAAESQSQIGQTVTL